MVPIRGDDVVLLGNRGLHADADDLLNVPTTARPLQRITKSY